MATTETNRPHAWIKFIDPAQDWRVGAWLPGGAGGGSIKSDWIKSILVKPSEGASAALTFM